MVTDANGRLSKLIGPLTANDVGYWIMRMTQFPNGGVFGRLEWIVDQVPFKLTVSNTILEPGELFNWVITGARPNSPVKWSSWKNGVSTGEVDVHYGAYTDASGNYIERSHPHHTSQPGAWTKQVFIGGQRTNVSFKVLDRPQFRFTVTPDHVQIGSTSVFQITGAPPNSPIKWSSWRNGPSTGEVEIFYGSYTDAQGNWSETQGPWPAGYEGYWIKQAIIGDQTVSTGFAVGNMTTPLPSVPNVAYSYTPLTYDGANNRYYSDLQVHKSSSNPETDPIMDMTARAYFSDAQGTVSAGVELGEMSAFSTNITGGNFCLVEDIPAECRTCYTAPANTCNAEYKSKQISETANNAAIIAGCIGLGWIPVAGPLLAVICVTTILIKGASDWSQAIIAFNKCACPLVNNCTTSTGKNCAGLWNNQQALKKQCERAGYVTTSFIP
jgi:hypothetical protein